MQGVNICTELTKTLDLDPKEREKIINGFAPLIKYIASRIASRLPPHIDLDDLISAGVIGLIDAIEKFAPDKQVNFKTYAEFRIRGAILDELRSMDWVPRSVRKKARKLKEAYIKLEDDLGRPANDEEVANELGLDIKAFYGLLTEATFTPVLSLDGKLDQNDDTTLKDVVPDKKNTDVQEMLFRKETWTIIKNVLGQLSCKGEMSLTLYYLEEMTELEIAGVLGIEGLS